MKFLFFTQYYTPESGSPPVRLPAMARELTALGHSVEVVAPMPNHPREQIFPEYRGRFYLREVVDGIVVHRVWLYAAVGSGLKRLLNFVTYAATSLVGLMRARRPDYILVNLPPLTLSIPAVIAARLRRARVILHVADIWPDLLYNAGLMKDGIMYRGMLSLERWAYRRAAYVDAVTLADVEKLRDEKGVSPDKLIFFPNGADPDVFRPGPYDEEWAAQHGLGSERVVLFAGSLGYIHALDTALEAARLLRSDRIRWVFVGGGSDRRRTMERAETLGINNVSFHEPVDAEGVARYYRVADAGVALFIKSPALNGTISAKVLPCMSAAKPIVFSGDGATARLIQDAGAGVVTPASDADALAGAIRDLLADPDRAAEMGRNGRQYVLAHLSWKAIVTRWLSRIENLDAGNGGRQ